MTRTDHQVDVVEVKLLDGKREERQVVTIEPVDQRQALDERGPDAMAGDRGRHAAGDVDQREQVGLGQQLTEDLEGLLAAAHAGEPVVNEGCFHDRPTS